MPTRNSKRPKTARRKSGRKTGRKSFGRKSPRRAISGRRFRAVAQSKELTAKYNEMLRLVRDSIERTDETVRTPLTKKFDKLVHHTDHIPKDILDFYRNNFIVIGNKNLAELQQLAAETIMYTPPVAWLQREIAQMKSDPEKVTTRNANVWTKKAMLNHLGVSP
jgi:hypothetical protein